MVRLRFQKQKYTRSIKTGNSRLIQSGVECANRFSHTGAFAARHLGGDSAFVKE